MARRRRFNRVQAARAARKLPVKKSTRGIRYWANSILDRVRWAREGRKAGRGSTVRYNVRQARKLRQSNRR